MPPSWPKGKLLTRSGATTVCNEAVTKSKLHMVVYGEGGPGEALRWPRYDRGSNTMLVVPFCWELYGYHLILCLQATFAQLVRIGFVWDASGNRRLKRSSPLATSNVSSCAGIGPNAEDQLISSPTLVIGVLKGSGLFPYLLGSSISWTNSTPDLHGPTGRVLQSKAQPASYWHMWSILADDPADVHALGDLLPACYDSGLLGGLPSTDVLPHEAQAFSRVLLAKLLLSEQHQQVACGVIRVLVVQRAQRYKILNIDDVVDQIKRELEAAPIKDADRITQRVQRRVTVRVASFENMTIRQQVELAASTDVLVGVHGNALSWSSMMPPSAAVVELWPNRPYNRNYADFALRHNLAYFSVEGRTNGCRARCPASFNLRESGILSRVALHLDSVACHGEVFNTTDAFLLEKDHTARRRREKLGRNGG